MSDIAADTAALKQRFESLSQRVRGHAKAGFGFVADLNQEKLTILLDYIVNCIEGGVDLDDAKGAELSGLSDQRVRNIFTAATLIGFAVLDFDLDPVEVSRLLPESLINESDRGCAATLASHFSNRKLDLKEGLEKKRLSSTVLPVFQRLNIEVDLRFDFDRDEQVKRVVPVAIAHIQTDNRSDEFFVQFDYAAIDSVIQKLTKIRDRMTKIAGVRIEHG